MIITREELMNNIKPPDPLKGEIELYAASFPSTYGRGVRGEGKKKGEPEAPPYLF